MSEAKSSTTVLNRIVAERENAIQGIVKDYPIAEIETLMRAQRHQTRSLERALKQPNAGFILECKKASPSKGLIRADFDPVAIAKTYAPYAAAISVLTEPNHFQGSFAYLSAVRASVTQPVLCKDFITTPEHVVLARYFGADAILLMLSVLSDTGYQQLAEQAEALGLDVLTEVSTEAEMQRAAALKAKIIGINNRNLHDLSIDPQRSIKLSKLAPSDALLVAESGFNTHAQVRATAPYVNGFLVGSALTAQADIDAACRQLIFGEHKVCGLTRAEDALAAKSLGAAFGGLIFVPHSKRCISIEQAQQIQQQVPKFDYVAVVANQPVDEVANIMNTLGLAYVQLHGDEDNDFIAALRAAIPRPIKVWKALSAHADFRLPDLAVERWLVDNGKGGTGTAFPWQWFTQLSNEQRLNCQLAGGLAPENIAAALQTEAAGLDLNSGVELKPGIKCPGKLRTTFDIIRRYGKECL